MKAENGSLPGVKEEERLPETKPMLPDLTDVEVKNEQATSPDKTPMVSVSHYAEWLM